MGVDAQLYYTTRVKQTNEEVLALASRLYEAYYGEPFFLYNDNHCLTIIPSNTIEQDGEPETFPETTQLVEVHLSGRYYGEGYERGDLPTICSICDWIEFNVPHAELWYGGDSSGVCAEPFTKHKRELLLEYFYEHGHKPYRKGFKLHNNYATCDRCHIKMNDVGGGGGTTFFSCGGCNEKVIADDKSNVLKRWRGHKDFFEVSNELKVGAQP
jgi:hypothetical protein